MANDVYCQYCGALLKASLFLPSIFWHGVWTSMDDPAFPEHTDSYRHVKCRLGLPVSLLGPI